MSDDDFFLSIHSNMKEIITTKQRNHCGRINLSVLVFITVIAIAWHAVCSNAFVRQYTVYQAFDCSDCKSKRSCHYEVPTQAKQTGKRWSYQQRRLFHSSDFAVMLTRRSKSTWTTTGRRLRISPTRRPSSSTALHLSSNLPSFVSSRSFTTIRATGLLLVSVFSAMKIENLLEQKFKNGSHSSWTILSTLMISATFSSIGWAPAPPLAIYDACWTLFLPASLAFLLLSLKSNTTTQVIHSSNDSSGTTKPSFRPRTSIAIPSATAYAVIRLAVPFILACLGSLLGCYVAFHFVIESGMMSPILAAIAASCLSASFIGGSVNFMATAAALSKPTSSDVANLVSAMGTADIVVMAVYFCVLSAALQSHRLQRLFHGRFDAMTLKGTTTNEHEIIKERSATPRSRMARSAGATLFATLITLLLVIAARRFEYFTTNMRLSIPGTACAFLAAATPITSNVFSNLIGQLNQGSFSFWNDIQQSSSYLSRLSFLLLFASLGVSVDINGAIIGIGLPCLIFSFMALAIHGIFTLVACVVHHHIVSWLSPKTTRGQRCPDILISLADVLVASNAAIGGPATAAAFCGSVKNYDSRQRQGLATAATVWGVVGYAIGTTIGLTLYRFLRPAFIANWTG